MDIFGLEELTYAEEEAMWWHSNSEDGSDDSSSVGYQWSTELACSMGGSDISEEGPLEQHWLTCSNNPDPTLPCMVDIGPKLESGVKVEACPDSGCTMSLISEDFAKKIGVRILRTPKKLYGATGANIQIGGQGIIFVKVEGVSVKRLRVLVMKKDADDLIISYHDLITLRVLATNFPNQVTNKQAPSLPHPNGNTSEVPLLTCRVRSGSAIDVSVDAVPDTGCTGHTAISEDFARRCGINVYPTSFESMDSIVSGRAWISIKIKDQLKINRTVMVSNITDDMLLCWSDLIDLGVLPGNFPSPAPE